MYVSKYPPIQREERIALMIFSIICNLTLAVLWGAMYLHGGPAYMLYASGLATGVAVMCIAVQVWK